MESQSTKGWSAIADAFLRTVQGNGYATYVATYKATMHRQIIEFQLRRGGHVVNFIYIESSPQTGGYISLVFDDGEECYRVSAAEVPKDESFREDPTWEGRYARKLAEFVDEVLIRVKLSAD